MDQPFWNNSFINLQPYTFVTVSAFFGATHIVLVGHMADRLASRRNIGRFL